MKKSIAALNYGQSCDKNKYLSLMKGKWCSKCLWDWVQERHIRKRQAKETVLTKYHQGRNAGLKKKTKTKTLHHIYQYSVLLKCRDSKV